MDKDIVTRLRCCSPYSEDGTINSNMRLIAEAANEITTLREQLQVAREGLEAVIKHQKTIGGSLSPMSATVGIAATALARIDAMKEKPNA